MIVHFPMVLAVLSPVVLVTILLVSRKTRIHGSIWVAVLALQFVLTTSSFIAMSLGEGDEEMVEKVVSERIIEEHEEWGEAFGWVTLVPLAFCASILFSASPYLKAGAVAGSALVLFMAIPTGHSGAELVYRHNAAKVFAGSVGFSAGGAFGMGGESHKDDDD